MRYGKLNVTRLGRLPYERRGSKLGPKFVALQEGKRVLLPQKTLDFRLSQPDRETSMIVSARHHKKQIGADAKEHSVEGFRAERSSVGR